MQPLTRSVCVFCGARPGNNPAHLRTARDVGAMLARRGWRLVYGAGDLGLMGETARAAMQNGGATFGVIPRHLMGAEDARTDLSTLVITETMHERKKVMFANSDAMVVLPGGAGSLDEFFEVLTWRQLGLHAKPIILLDSAGYWAPLTGLIRHVIDQGFADPSLAGFFHTVEGVAALEERLCGALNQAA
ncbi:TIGR00730 family Rossman fold protein [Rhodobacteraceae bacterium 2376]|uniref:Cytokinin riboside 5'-monophosphate phosphoribohydrolase n=1 Tax=Rhabdonatronobacter sediminivivens TaxID=2743469 RepID=A0A7Z0KZU5_9RHOB|nr:TIGR00730 family Rossman fold protein [Rhabdonatronobacter sediminivivens]NYS25806.1 TIGR00730 family Rossman fold protein [Rhabdonatronobacter sediminivivens]